MLNRNLLCSFFYYQVSITSREVKQRQNKETTLPYVYFLQRNASSAPSHSGDDDEGGLAEEALWLFMCVFFAYRMMLHISSKQTKKANRGNMAVE